MEFLFKAIQFILCAVFAGVLVVAIYHFLTLTGMVLVAIFKIIFNIK
jgi:hypothetical protein